MEPTTRTMDEPLPVRQEEGGGSVPVLLARAAALVTAIEGQAAKLAADAGRQLADLHGMAPMAPMAPMIPVAAPAEIDPSALVAQAQEKMVETIARLRALAEGMGVSPGAAATGASLDPLGALLTGLAGHAQDQLGGHVGMGAAVPATLPIDIDLKAIVSSAQAAHDQALRALNDLMSGMGLDPADPTAGLAQLLPRTTAAPPAPDPADGGGLLGSLQADTQRLQAMLAGLSAKIIPPT